MLLSVTSKSKVRLKRRDRKDSNEFNLLHSSLYRQFLAEREEILKYKWLQSEKLGRDIGYERAMLEWIRHHRDCWRDLHKGSDIS